MNPVKQPNTPKPSANKSRKNRSRYNAKKHNRGPVAPRKSSGPAKQYISACCSLLALKPECGRKEMKQDSESKKLKSVPKGLGHWRCSGCGKSCKVKPGMLLVVEPTPAPEATVATT